MTEQSEFHAHLMDTVRRPALIYLGTDDSTYLLGSTHLTGGAHAGYPRRERVIMRALLQDALDVIDESETT